LRSQDIYCTVSVVLPLTPLEAAVITVLLIATPVARPVLLTVAIALELEVQDTELVITLVLPFE
jgi:hypothetical protein